MYHTIKKCLLKNDIFPLSGNILGISGIDHFYDMIDKSNSVIIEGNYPSIDMQKMPYKDSLFDFVISDQVIEHLEEPSIAISESFRVLKNGGFAIHTTCFLNYLHNCPKDYWRFSTDALMHLMREFSIIQCEGWGNRIAIFLCMVSSRFRLMIIPEKRFSIRRLIANFNEHHYPIVTWIIGKKENDTST
jgi:SAM-dependent methyltransferase